MVPSPRQRLVGAVFVSQMGTWLTFLGLLQYVQTRFGSAATAGAFLAQSLPAIFMARVFVQLVPRFLIHRAWLAIQLVLAACSASLALWDAPLWYIYLFFATTTVLRAIANPLLMTLISDWVPTEERASAYTAVGTAGSITLAISPAAGGVVATYFGYGWLFISDAVTFLLASLILLCPAHVESESPPNEARASSRSVRQMFHAWIGKPSGAAQGLGIPMMAWAWFSVAGAAVNAVELPVFNLVHHFDAKRFGFALACYGAGGFLAFLIAQLRPRWKVPAVPVAAAYLAGLAGWVFGGKPGPYLGFLLAGLTYGLLSGRLRAYLDEGAAIDRVDRVALWAWANQVILISNIAIYGLAAAAFAAGASVFWLAGVMLLAAVGLVLQVVRVPMDLSAHPVDVSSR